MFRKLPAFFLLLVLVSACDGFVLQPRVYDAQARDLYIRARNVHDPEKAIIYLNEADEIEPNNPWILGERGHNRWQLDHYAPALSDLTQAIELHTDQTAREVCYERRGLVHSYMNNQQLACDDWRKAGGWGQIHLSECPENPTSDD